jgi:hypothetical protein
MGAGAAYLKTAAAPDRTRIVAGLLIRHGFAIPGFHNVAFLAAASAARSALPV